MSEWDQIEPLLDDTIVDVAELVAIMANQYLENPEYKDRLLVEIKDRYETGRAAHAESDSTWDHWTKEDFVKNLAEELLDAIIYGAAFAYKYGETDATVESR